jgi:hypothetical protein
VWVETTEANRALPRTTCSGKDSFNGKPKVLQGLDNTQKKKGAYR